MNKQKRALRAYKQLALLHDALTDETRTPRPRRAAYMDYALDIDREQYELHERFIRDIITPTTRPESLHGPCIEGSPWFDEQWEYTATPELLAITVDELLKEAGIPIQWGPRITALLL